MEAVEINNYIIIRLDQGVSTIKILKDYNNTINKFTYINNQLSLNGEPLKKSIVIDESIMRYLTGIYNITELGDDFTTKNLLSYLEFSPNSHSSLHNFMKRKEKFLAKYVNIILTYTL